MNPLRSVAPPDRLAAAVEAERAWGTEAGAARGPEESIRGPEESIRGPEESIRGPEESIRGVDPRAGGVDPRAGGVDPRAGGVDPRAGGVDPRAGGVDPGPRAAKRVAPFVARPAHERLDVRPDFGLDRVHRRRRAHEERAPLRTAPVQVRRHLGDAHGAELRTVGRVDADPPRCGHPDVAFGVALHAVGEARLARGLDSLREEPRVGERAAGGDVEDPDDRPGGVVHIELALVGREAEPVRLVELALVDGEVELAVRRHAEDALPAELARTFDAVVRHPPEPRIGEVDGAVGAHAHVVRAVELLALEVRGQDLALSPRAQAHQARGGVLADDEVQLRVVGHAVALVGGAHHLAHASRLVPPPAHVARHVGEQQVVLGRVPDRSFGELEARADLPHRRVGVDEGGELAAAHVVGHRFLGPVWAAHAARCLRIAANPRT